MREKHTVNQPEKASDTPLGDVLLLMLTCMPGDSAAVNKIFHITFPTLDQTAYATPNIYQTLIAIPAQGWVSARWQLLLRCKRATWELRTLNRPCGASTRLCTHTQRRVDLAHKIGTYRVLSICCGFGLFQLSRPG